MPLIITFTDGTTSTTLRAFPSFEPDDNELVVIDGECGVLEVIDASTIKSIHWETDPCPQR